MSKELHHQGTVRGRVWWYAACGCPRALDGRRKLRGRGHAEALARALGFDRFFR